MSASNKIAEFHEITPNVYLGSYDGFYDKQFNNLNITHIISLTPEEETPLTTPNTKNIIKYRFPITGKTPISDSIEIIKSVASLINELMNNQNNKIYVHCYEGVSRSAACIIYYAHQYKNIPNSLQYVISKRPNVNPNERMTECLNNLIQ